LSGGSINEPVLILWDLETGKELRRLQGHQHGIRGGAFLPDGQRAVSGSFDGTIRLWDLKSGKEIRRFEGFDRPDTAPSAWPRQVWSLAVSPDGRKVLAGFRDHTVRLFDVESGRQLHCLRGHKKFVNAVAFAPDGQRALSANGDIFETGEESDNTIRLWDLQTGRQLQCFKSMIGSVWAVAVSPDGQRGLVVGEEKSVLLFHVDDGQEIQRYTGHAAQVQCVALSPDGKRAVTGGADQTIRVWRLPPK
jgi:WD40 repeat protein